MSIAANHTHVPLMVFLEALFKSTSLKPFLGQTLQQCSVWLEEASLLPLHEPGFNVAHGNVMEQLVVYASSCVAHSFHFKAPCVVCVSVSMLFGNILIAYAYQIAPPPTVAAFENSYLFFAAMWGILLFAETPDSWTILGIAMIACAGFLALRSTAHD